MDLSGKRFIVAGASGELGTRFARALAGGGALVALTARDDDSIAELAAELDAPALAMEITDADSRAAAADAAIRELGGVDGLVVATGAVAFGNAGELDTVTEERLMAINATGPMALISSLVERIEGGGAIIVLSAVVAEYPTAGMAAYSASKAALSAYVEALRRERRRQLSTVLEVRPGHMETGFADRALAGEPPRMPEPEDPDELVSAVLSALDGDKRLVAYDPMERSLKTS